MFLTCCAVCAITGVKGQFAEVVGVEEKRDGRRDGLARLIFSPCPGEEIECGVFGPVSSKDDCGVILRYITGEKVLYG